MKNNTNLQNFIILFLDDKNSFSIELFEWNLLAWIREKFSRKIYYNWPNLQKDVYLEIKNEKTFFNFVIWFFPFWISLFNKWDNDLNFREISYIYILELLKNIDKNWVWLFLVLPNIFTSQEWKKFIYELNKKWFYINAVLNSSNILEIDSWFKPIFILVSQEKKEKVFICEPTENTDFKIILDNYYNKSYVGENLSFWFFVKKEDFLNFPNYKIKQSIKILDTTYKNFNCYKLWEIWEIIRLKKWIKINSPENSLFFPIHKDKTITFNLSDVENKENYYIQITFNKEKALSKYIEIFFKSQLWKLIKESFSSFSYIPWFKINDILNFEIYLPLEKQKDLEKQKEIISSYEKFEELKNLINLTKNELSISPNLKEITKNMIKLESQLKQTTEANKIKNQILEWESQVLEFKKCLWDNKKDKTWYNITQAILKTMVGFFNTKWWTVLIWVDNDWKIIWIEEDKNYIDNDKYKNKFDNYFKEYIWEKYFHLIKEKSKNIVLVEWKKVLVLEVKESTVGEVFLKNKWKKESYIRWLQWSFKINEDWEYIDRNCLSKLKKEKSKK